MTKDELSLLLYCEARATDRMGATDSRNMNEADRAILAVWNESGFVASGRICSEYVLQGRDGWVRLSHEATVAAHAERLARAERAWKDRSWRTTAEKRTGRREP